MVENAEVCLAFTYRFSVTISAILFAGSSKVLLRPLRCKCGQKIQNFLAHSTNEEVNKTIQFGFVSEVNGKNGY